MPPFGSAALNWFERQTGTSQSREAWLGRMPVLAWAFFGAAVYLLSRRLTTEPRVVLFGIWCLVLAILLRRDLLRLFGPVFQYELIRLARRPRYLFARVGFAALLAVVFSYTYVLWAERQRDVESGVVPIHAQAELANTFFIAYMVIQFLVVALLTPGFVAGAIAEEKERKTLEFMLATDLGNREIVFGKLAARVGNMALFLLAGLPVLSFVQFFGGVDPDQLLAGFAATFLIMLSLSAVSLFCSVTAKRVRDAVALAYLMAFAYFAASLFSLPFQSFADAQQSIVVLNWTISWADVAHALGIGNPINAIGEWERQGSSTPGVLMHVLGQFALFHGVVVALFVAWSVLRLRAVALKQSYSAAGRRAIERTVRGRPDIGDEPMIWKEVFVESGVKMSLLGRIIVLLIAAGTFAIAFYIAYEILVVERGSTWESFAEAMNSWTRVVGTLVSCLFLLAIAVQGAGSVRGERDRQTIDSLLTTPLSSSQIIWGKWWGCMLGMRKAWIWLGAIWLTGVATGGVHFVALPFLVVSIAVYASGFAWIGIWCSIVPSSSLRATLSALIAGLLAGGGYLIVFGFCCLLPLSYASRGVADRDLESVLMQFMCGFSPVVVMAYLPMYDFSPRELDWLSFRHETPFYPFALIGLIGWIAFSYLLSNSALRRFRSQVNRSERHGT